MDEGSNTVSRRFKVGVMPMTDGVLFPGVTLPLHVFEHPHQLMIQELEKQGWPLAISLVIPQKEKGFRLNEICGAGKFQVSHVYSDGHKDILIHGKERIRLRGFIQTEPYCVMEAESLSIEPALGASLTRSFEEFRALIKGWIFLNPTISDNRTLEFDTFHSYGELTDFFVYHFLKKVREKQDYLNCMDPLKRAERLARYLESDLCRQGKKTVLHRKYELIH